MSGVKSIPRYEEASECSGYFSQQGGVEVKENFAICVR